jgi:pseudaminic acid biosynthesis-associated methylase
MTHTTSQTEIWQGEFGRQYTDRHEFTEAGTEELYIKHFGFSRTSMNEEFIGGLDRKLRILEVGCNLGLQLKLLQKMGFQNLYGVELQPYAVNRAQKTSEGLNIVQGSAFDVPFKDGWFDLVFTSGVLIHISPDDLPRAISEIYRCSRSLIWGYEYYSETPTEVAYRGHGSLMWKRDFARAYREQLPDLETLKQKTYPYLNDPSLKDTMYLLRKKVR